MKPPATRPTSKTSTAAPCPSSPTSFGSAETRQASGLLYRPRTHPRAHTLLLQSYAPSTSTPSPSATPSPPTTATSPAFSTGSPPAAPSATASTLSPTAPPQPRRRPRHRRLPQARHQDPHLRRRRHHLVASQSHTSRPHHHQRRPRHPAARRHRLERRPRETGKRIHIYGKRTRFEGTATITDPDALRTAILQGVGRNCAYGAGLPPSPPQPHPTSDNPRKKAPARTRSSQPRRSTLAKKSKAHPTPQVAKGSDPHARESTDGQLGGGLPVCGATRTRGSQPVFARPRTMPDPSDPHARESTAHELGAVPTDPERPARAGVNRSTWASNPNGGRATRTRGSQPKSANPVERSRPERPTRAGVNRRRTPRTGRRGRATRTCGSQPFRRAKRVQATASDPHARECTGPTGVVDVLPLLGLHLRESAGGVLGEVKYPKAACLRRSAATVDQRANRARLHVRTHLMACMRSEMSDRVGVWIWAKFSNLPWPYPLICHMLDTAAMVGVLWDEFLDEGQRRQIADGFGTSVDEARAMAMFWAGLHDIGKCCPHFVGQPSGPKPELLDEPEFAAAAGWMHEEPIRHERVSHLVVPTLLARYGYPAGLRPSRSVAHQVGQILGGHHGRYGLALDRATMADPGKAEPRVGTASGWVAQRHALTDALFDACGRPVPPTRVAPAGTAVIVTGLIVLADWLASQTDWLLARGTQWYTAKDDDHVAHYARAVKAAPRHVQAAQLGTASWKPAGTFQEVFPTLPAPTPPGRPRSTPARRDEGTGTAARDCADRRRENRIRPLRRPHHGLGLRPDRPGTLPADDGHHRRHVAAHPHLHRRLDAHRHPGHPRPLHGLAEHRLRPCR